MEWLNDEIKRHVDMAKEFLGLKNRDAHAELPGVMSDSAEKKMRKTMSDMRRKNGPGLYQADVE